MEGGVRRITGELTLWFAGLSENTGILGAPFLTVVLLPVWVQQGSESGFVRGSPPTKKNSRLASQSA